MVPVNPFIVSEPMLIELSIVAVTAAPPDVASKNTFVVASGRLPAPGAPPETVAQWFAASDQFPEPPTQYAFAGGSVT
jgi:hypothetical protein